jgi:ATP-binding cassette subfamily B protein
MEDNAQLTSYLVESLNGIQTVKAFNAEDGVRTETEFRFVKLLRSVFHLGTISNYQETMKTFVEKVGGVIIIWVGAYNVMQGHMTIGGLVTFTALLVYFLGPIKNLIDLQATMQTAIVASDRLGEILDLELERSGNQASKIVPHSLKGDINFDDVSFRYGTRQLVLDHFTMHIKQGQRVAVVGESGAGKTTLAKLLLNFYPIEAGNITVADYSLPDIQLDALREKIAYVPQETFLFSGSIFENLTFGIQNPKMEEVIRCAKLAQIHEMINLMPLRYETYLDENGSNLSGGQRQRLAIARAMLKTPDILILDEATSNLDAVTERAIQQTLDVESQKLTSIIIAHRLSTIRNCDVIFVMEKGRIIESGSHDELIRQNGYYASLYQAQIGE